MTAQEILTTLHSLANEPYRRFAAGLIPRETELLGVRLPALRRLAKKAAATHWQELFGELRKYRWMEAVMLRGMLPGYAPHATLSERLAALADFIPHIRNWSICDSSCATYKFAAQHREELLAFLRPRLCSGHEYEARFAVVMLLLYYLDTPEWAHVAAELLPTVTCPAYYARMAVAWCACELTLRHPTIAAPLLPQLPPEVQSLTRRKLRESRKYHR